MSPSTNRTLWGSIRGWFDNGESEGLSDDDPRERDHRIDPLRTVPFVLMHMGCLLVIWVGFSWVALALAVGLYLLRMFAITGFYHRYFSHRTFRTSRVFQFIMGFVGTSAAQRGPMWWAAHHRHHHNHSDEDVDVHSPRLQGLIMSHMGWFLRRSSFHTRTRYVRDWAIFPELRFLDRFDVVAPFTLGALCYLLGAALAAKWPHLGTGGWQMFVWGFFISTVAVYHGTYTINSLAHTFGTKRFETGDDSRNNWWLSIITLGEGWHNNHHHYPATARQGFYWWEFDPTYYVLKVMSWCGLIWDLRPVPDHALMRNRLDEPSIGRASRASGDHAEGERAT